MSGWIEARGRRYVARWRDEDGRKRSEPCDTREAAELVLLKVRQQKRAGTYQPPTDATVKDVVESYLRRVRHRVSSGTVSTYEQRARVHLIPRFGDIKVRSLTSEMVQGMVDDLEDREYAPATIQGIVIVLHAALSRVRKQVGANVVDDVELPAIEPVRKATWSMAEVGKVLDALRGKVQWRAMYALMVSSGMRPGEIVALRWDDVDLVRGVVHVRRTRTRDEGGKITIGTTTKGRRDRAVAIGPGAVEALRAHREDQDKRRGEASVWRAGSAVFDSAKGSMSYSTWNEYHKEMVERVGVTPITLHGVRHTMATIMMEKNVHPKVVSEMLGHATVGMTLDIYSHVDAELQRQAADRLDGQIFGK